MTSVLEMSDVTMPQLSPNVAEGRIVRWFVREGQTVEPGDLLAEVGFGASTVEVEAHASGRIASLLHVAGTEGIKAHAPIARLAHSRHEESADTVEAAVPVADVHAEASVIGHESAGAGARKHALDYALASDVAMLTYREALRDALTAALTRDPRIVVMGEDVEQNRGALRVTQGLHDAFGDARVVTLRPLDDAAFGLALGASIGGCVPVLEVASWGTALEALGPALETAGTLPALSGGRVGVPFVVRGPNGWAAGSSGSGAENVAPRLMHVPNLKVVAPSTPAAAKLLLAAALRDGGPVAVLEAEDLYECEGPVPIDVDYSDIIGRAHVARHGSRLTLVTYGQLVPRALSAAARLGETVEVVDVLSLRPLDIATIAASLKKTRRLLIVEEGAGAFGIGSEIIARLAADPSIALDKPPGRLSGMPGPVPYSSAYAAMILPSAERIEAAVAQLLD